MPSAQPTDQSAAIARAEAQVPMDQVGVVKKTYPHTETADGRTGGVDVRLVGEGQRKLKNIPVAAGFHGETRLPRKGQSVIIRWLRSDPPFPYVAQAVYTEKNPSPIGKPGTWAIETGGARAEVARDGTITLDASAVAINADTFDYPGKQQAMAGGGVGGGGGVPITAPVGNIPGTNPKDPPKKRAKDAGFDIRNTKTVNKLEDIDGQANTLYIVDGAMTMDGKHGLGDVNNVAICGKNDARLIVPPYHREYTLTTTGGVGIMWSGIDIDQRNEGACGGLNLKAQDKTLIEYMQFHGYTGIPGYKGGPVSDQSKVADPVLHTPALSSSGLVEIRDINLVSGGWMEHEHSWGVGPIGLFLAQQHTGTVHIKNSRFAAFPSDATYATNTTGRVLMDNVNFHTNGTASGRIARGYYKNCTCVFDYEKSPLQGGQNTNNGCLGLEAEAKQGVSHVDIINCTVKMVNVDECPAGIAARHLQSNTPGKIGKIKNCDVHIGSNAQNAADIWVNDGSSVDSITGCTFSGTATGGQSILNNGTIGSHSNNTFDYPSGRQTGF